MKVLSLRGEGWGMAKYVLLGSPNGHEKCKVRIPCRCRAPRHSPTRELAELGELLRIPSISADEAHAPDVRAAAEWLVELFRSGGAEARIVERAGRPLVDALVRVERRPAPRRSSSVTATSTSSRRRRSSSGRARPFAPEVRDGWLYARGVADDKGQLWALARAALDLAQAGRLPVDVRFCLDCEEEVGGTSVVDYIEETAGDARACVIFDTAMLDDDTPVLTIATRGTLYLHVEVRTGERDLHSGALRRSSAERTARARRRARRASCLAPVASPVRCGTASTRRTKPSSPAGRACPPAMRSLPRKVRSPADGDAADEFYLRTWGLPSIDVNGIEGGSPVLQRTIVTSAARANLSMRLAPGQTVERDAAAVCATSSLVICRTGRASRSSTSRRAIPVAPRRTHAPSSSPPRRSSAPRARGRSCCGAGARCRSCRCSSGSASRRS